MYFVFIYSSLLLPTDLWGEVFGDDLKSKFKQNKIDLAENISTTGVWICYSSLSKIIGSVIAKIFLSINKQDK